MKLLGIELRNYARFKQCFVPLGDTGVRLLVGRNNSGKTAILRALSALSALPFRGNSPLPGDVARYLPDQSPLYEMDIVFGYEDQEKTFFGSDLSLWSPFAAAVNKKWVYSFRALPHLGRIQLFTATLRADKDFDLPLIGFESNVLTRFMRNGHGIVSGRSQLRIAGNGPAAIDGTPVATYELDGPYLSQFAALMSTRYIHVHRVVKPYLSLQTLETLNDNAESLAPFLDTLNSNRREVFSQIEKVVTNVFPEFKYVNPEKSQNGVSITLTSRDTNQTIPLTHCGTGVEQIIALAAFVLTSKRGSLILLDEPHSYLHPIAERQLLDFLNAHNEHRYVISTHSAILINSVSADRILALDDSTDVQQPTPDNSTIPRILHALGYRNSDLLFHDRLILVEGESDQDILPLLLGANPIVSRPDLKKTGFPVMDGEGKLRGRDQQRSLLYWEKFLSQLGRAKMPRIYLFDGGCLDADRELLQKSNVFQQDAVALLRFLPLHEIENYLLVPEAILASIEEMVQIQDGDSSVPKKDEVETGLKDILSKTDNRKLYPNGVLDNDPLRSVKGSVVLEALFDSYGLRYEKRKVGRLIATKINSENQPLLKALWSTFPLNFLPQAPT